MRPVTELPPKRLYIIVIEKTKKRMSNNFKAFVR